MFHLWSKRKLGTPYLECVQEFPLLAMTLELNPLDRALIIADIESFH
jgi:hypothetical protein